MKWERYVVAIFSWNILRDKKLCREKQEKDKREDEEAEKEM